MKIDQTTVRKVAHLARLDFAERDEAAMLESMSEILDWVEQLNEVDTTGVEPLTNMSYEVNALREDRVGEHLSREQGLRHAPRHDGEYLRVPKVME
jgi:aspartyl-tRNA(Asn)/glutamyl-tRNA(Gln) amidotransferase subunit C